MYVILFLLIKKKLWSCFFSWIAKRMRNINQYCLPFFLNGWSVGVKKGRKSRWEFLCRQIVSAASLEWGRRREHASNIRGTPTHRRPLHTYFYLRKPPRFTASKNVFQNCVEFRLLRLFPSRALCNVHRCFYKLWTSSKLQIMLISAFHGNAMCSTFIICSCAHLCMAFFWHLRKN